jgi:dTDP-4-dehydrorhamnose reductase
MRCLVIGGTGFLGSCLLDACDDRLYPTLATAYRRPPTDYAALDVRDADAVGQLLADYQPDVTFFAAGGGPGVVSAGAANVARAVARHGGTLTLLSGDEVFGECPAARTEAHAVAPVNGRGREQAAAEHAVRTALPGRHLILRTSWAFGPAGGRLAGWVQRWKHGEAVDAATDRDLQPTFAPDLAEVALELVKARQAGVVHVVGPDRHTQFTLARLACHVLGYDTDLVQPVGGSCDRPARVNLDRFKLRGLLGAKCVRPVADGLRAVRASRPLKLLAA